jgi:V8-like Glu-specific endopeptidase
VISRSLRWIPDHVFAAASAARYENDPHGGGGTRVAVALFMHLARMIKPLLVALLAACADVEATAEEEEGFTSESQIMGANDLVVVKEDGANIPAKYRPLVDAFGQLSMGCTATHVGDGLVVSAGHCFNKTKTGRRDGVPCTEHSVKWGLRVDKAPYLTSRCTSIVAEEWSDKRDYAFLRVTPIPPVKVDLKSGKRPAFETKITIFGHPQKRPLEWSQTCRLKNRSIGGFAFGFAHRCDTEPGNSGSTILDDASLEVIGVHDGGSTAANYATYLVDTPIDEVLTGAKPGAGGAGRNAADGGGAPPAGEQCVYGDGLYCGGNGVSGEPAGLYLCSGGVPTLHRRCANGCAPQPAGTDDACAR